MRRIKSDSPEKAAARLDRFLAAPPKRISAEQVARRRKNATRKAKRKGTLERVCGEQKWKCAYCGKPMTNGVVGGDVGRRATIDHVKPISKGGSNRRANLVGACQTCNVSKGDMTVEEWRGLGKENPGSDCAARGAADITRDIVLGL